MTFRKTLRMYEIPVWDEFLDILSHCHTVLRVARNFEDTTIPQTGFGHFQGPYGFWPVTFSHTLGINKLHMRIDTTIKPVSPFGPAFEAEDLFIVLTTKEIIILL